MKEYKFEDGVACRNGLKINLSLLMRYVNISHLTIDSKLINSLDDKKLLNFFAIFKPNKFKSLNPDNEYHSPDERAVAKLAPALQFALHVYTGDEGYNINNFLRSNLEFSSPYLNFNNATQEQLLSYFLISCLANQAINELPILYSCELKKEKEKKYIVIRLDTKPDTSIFKNISIGFAQVKKDVYLIDKKTDTIELLGLNQDAMCDFDRIAFPNYVEKNKPMQLSPFQIGEIHKIILPKELMRRDEHAKTFDHHQGIIKFSGIFSTSQGLYNYKKGVSMFLNKRKNPGFNPSIFAVSQHQNENEVAFYHNIFLRHHPAQNILTEIRGTNICSDHFLSDSALRYVFYVSLSKEYPKKKPSLFLLVNTGYIDQIIIWSTLLEKLHIFAR